MRAAMLVAPIVLAGVTCAAQTPADSGTATRSGGFVDVAFLGDPNRPATRRFRNRGTTPRVNEVTLNMYGVWLTKAPSESSRWGVELAGHGGEDAKAFGFSSSAPNLRGADILLHLGPTNTSYLAPVGNGLTIQGGIFNSVIGYDGLYAKDNISYTRPWGADYTPYLMLGVNAKYPFTARLTGTLVIVNGYFHLAHANDVPNVGMQLAATATERVTVKQALLVGPHQSSTAAGFWRTLSDTIVERRTARLTTALEYQLGVERVDVPARPRALWMAVQVPIRWSLGAPWSVALRPELAWDRDGRWIAGAIGSGQSIAALTSTLEFRRAYGGANTVVRVEHRFDRSRGSGGGFFDRSGGLTPRQHLLIVALVVSVDRTAHG